MKCIINGKLILPDRIVENRAILFRDHIEAIPETRNIPSSGLEIYDARGKYVAPGLVDVHCHGCVGEDTSDANPDGIRKMSRALIENGVTSWLPTTMTLPLEELDTIFATLREAQKESRHKDTWHGAEILGANMEGPFINPKKKGAHKEEYIIPPSAAYVKKHRDIIRLVTIAPEVEGAMAFIDEIHRDTDIALSMGHSAANYEQAMEAIQKGVTHTTHLFNAMTGVMHREPGMAGAALSSRVNCELIADTFHIHPGLFQMVAKAKGKHLVLITDCMRAGGLPDGQYDLGGQTATVSGIQCRLEDGTIAGSVLRLNKAVENFMRHTDLPIWEIVAAASLNPATAIGEDERKGSLEVGKDADIIIADENFTIQKTFVGGNCEYAK